MLRHTTLFLLCLCACPGKEADKGNGGGRPSDGDDDDDGYSVLYDCDDADPAISPAASEVCDGADNDCDGLIDQDDDDVVLNTGYTDHDGDGYGDSATAVQTCASEGMVLEGGDCDDNDKREAPGNAEIEGDGLDNDCDPSTPDDGGGDEGGGEDLTARVIVDWELLTVRMVGTTRDLTLGIAETDAGSRDSWTGEDCLYGYTDGDGDFYLYCHPMEGGRVDLRWDGNPRRLDEETETAFTPDLIEVMTFAVWDEDASCYAFGHDPSYYADAGCDEVDMELEIRLDDTGWAEEPPEEGD